jgi:GT2 family glycosyltransferase
MRADRSSAPGMAGLNPAGHLVALVVTCNRLAKLKVALDQCRREGFDHVVVVNTGPWIEPEACGFPTDGSSASTPRFELLQLNENVGGAGGFQIGLAHIYGLYRLGLLPRNSWCVLFDDDAYPEAGCLGTFRAHQDSYQSVAALAAAVVSPQGRAVEVNRPILNVFRSAGRLKTVLSRGWPRSARDWYHVPTGLIEQPGAVCAVDAISFVGLFLNLALMPAHGWPLPDSRLFIYSDDTLFTWSLRRGGGQLLLVSSLRFVHDTATGYEAGLIRPVWKLFYLTRNSWQVYGQLGGCVLGPVLFAIGLVQKLCTCVRYSDRQDRRQARRAIRFALWDLCRHRRYRSFASLQAAME